MVTLQDISVQLMKPAKDLADWKFPLSQILEEYYALLEEPCNINFGEAALVLQNSTNVYVRRIERLFNETEVLKQTFFGYEEEEMKRSTCKDKKIIKKVYVNFDKFVIINLENDVGKSIDRKNQFQGQKKPKLLSRRFTQLENNITQLCIPIQMYDVLGETIGKKYDFRCNQSINTTGMLVDELTLHDFTYIQTSHVRKESNSSSSYSEPKTPGSETLVVSPNNNKLITPVHKEFETEDNFSLQMENIFLSNEPEILEKENILNKNKELSSSISNTTTLGKSLFKEQHTQSNKQQNINSKYCLIHNSNNTNQTKRKYQNDNSEQMNQFNQSCQNDEKNIDQFETIDLIGHYKQLNHVFKENRIIQLNSLNNAHWKEGLLSTQRKGNQAMKMSVYTIDDINEFDWKPISLIHGMKNVFSYNTSILKLPEYISLLETNFDSKKRKFTSKVHKTECLTKLILREAEISIKKNIISQIKPKFRHLQKQELEDFMKNFDQCLNPTEEENDNPRYTAVTNVTISLLGFCVARDQQHFMDYGVEKALSRNSSITNIKSQSTICENSLNMIEKSPNLHNSWCESSVSEINLSYSLPDYQTLIEDKMKEIFEESNVATELDQTVAKWHASLQPKLSEAEIRPAFRIHDYASHIITTLQALNQKSINFDNVVRHKPACEVARYFLASLQLANTYNVEIKTKKFGTNIEIELLNGGENCEKN